MRSWPAQTLCAVLAALALGLENGPAAGQGTAPAGFSEVGAEAIAIVQAELAELEAQRTALEAEVRQAGDRAASFREMLTSLDAETEAAQSRVRDAKAAVAAAEARLAELDRQTGERQAALRALESEIAAAESAREAAALI